MDDLRAIAGLVIFGAPLLFLKPVPWVAVALGAGTLVFLLYLGRCAIRHITIVQVSDTRIEIRAITSKSVDWATIDQVTLKHYSPKRRSGQGWMQLSVSGNARKIVIESGLEGFNGIAQRAAHVIGRNRLDVSVTTRANFKAMNIDLPAAVGIA